MQEQQMNRTATAIATAMDSAETEEGKRKRNGFEHTREQWDRKFSDLITFYFPHLLLAMCASAR